MNKFSEYIHPFQTLLYTARLIVDDPSNHYIDKSIKILSNELGSNGTKLITPFINMLWGASVYLRSFQKPHGGNDK